MSIIANLGVATSRAMRTPNEGIPAAFAVLQPGPDEPSLGLRIRASDFQAIARVHLTCAALRWPVAMAATSE